MKVAVVGSGPAAFYAVQRLLSKFPAKVDIFEKLPVPYGLTRFGVAPDHPEVKNCQDRFAEIAQHKDVAFNGNVEIGIDVPVKDLMDSYNAVLFAYGSQLDNPSNVVGAHHPAVRSARDFVGWYNGDPNHQSTKWDLSGVERVAVIGNGNVALDVARILLRDPSALAKTDITSRALEVLSRSSIKHVSIVGRRGALQAAYTTKELRELLTEPDVTLRPEPEIGDLLLCKNTLARGDKRKLELLEKGSKCRNGSKSWSLNFLRSPIEFVPKTSTALDGINYVLNKLDGLPGDVRAVPTNDTVFEPCDLAFLSIGYRGMPLPGFSEAGIPFDGKRGILPTQLGQVPGTNAFATGWIKTGPRGVIASTMMDAYAVGEDIARYLALQTQEMPGLAVEKATDWEGWQRINAHEIENGGAHKPREKILDTDEMVSIARGNQH